ncbi:unnamed protein product [Schistosoma curassoni]|uniref:C2 NT-type domain-containing protein n=1 Tax=Schistosoma curassoni TaxID=6186 RepID=A0A183KI19_9TREM|nr:unnamed protein product [Schistosoma curassoni]
MSIGDSINKKYMCFAMLHYRVPDRSSLNKKKFRISIKLSYWKEKFDDDDGDDDDNNNNNNNNNNRFHISDFQVRYLVFSVKLSY